jgi:hypothetical protein
MIPSDYDRPRRPEGERFCTRCGHRPGLHAARDLNHGCVLPGCECRYYYEGGDG